MDVKKFIREFMYGRTDVHNKQRSGRPSVLAETIAKVEQEMSEDQCVTVCELCEQIPEPAMCMQKCIDCNGDE